ncbi:MAG: hypothetical protein FJ405_04605, partial [Verrucomicrobia bacterium]|nr:hypothetical protein [Verrucomicrobiota bacterium]
MGYFPLFGAVQREAEIWVSPRPSQPGDNGTPTAPFGVGESGEFDRFMSQFRGIPNLTFRLMEGVFETAGVHEVLPGRPPHPHTWEPAHGWKILGQGMEKTIIRLTRLHERNPTKYHVIGNTTTGRPLSTLEVAYLTLDANGAAMSLLADSGFGCAYFKGSYIYLHHLECIGGFNALSPEAHNAASFREIFLLGIQGTHKVGATNNVIDRCNVRATEGSPKAFAGAVEGLTTAVINGAHIDERFPNAGSFNPRISNCLIDGLHPSGRLHGITMFGAINGHVWNNTVVNARFGFYSDDAPWTHSVRVEENWIHNVVSGVYLNYGDYHYRWGRVAVINNQIWVCKDCALPGQPSQSSDGINLVGARPPKPPSFETTYVVGNVVYSVDESGGGRINDYGIQVAYHRNALVASNQVGILRKRNSLKVLRDPLADERYWFFENVDASGDPLMVHDRSMPGCRSSDTWDITPCAYTNPFPWTPSVEALFSWVGEVTTNERAPIRPGFGSIPSVLLNASQADYDAPFEFRQDLGNELDSHGVSRTEDQGRMTFRVHVDQPGTFHIWLRMRPPD